MTGLRFLDFESCCPHLIPALAYHYLRSNMLEIEHRTLSLFMTPVSTDRTLSSNLSGLVVTAPGMTLLATWCAGVSIHAVLNLRTRTSWGFLICKGSAYLGRTSSFVKRGCLEPGCGALFMLGQWPPSFCDPLGDDSMTVPASRLLVPRLAFSPYTETVHSYPSFI